MIKHPKVTVKDSNKSELVNQENGDDMPHPKNKKRQWHFLLLRIKNLNKILKPKEKLIIYFFSFLLVSSVIGGSIKYYLNSTKTVPAIGGNYTEGISIDSAGVPTTINPLLSTTRPIDELISSVIFSSLFTYDNMGNIKKDLVDSYRVSNDGKEYAIKLKQNVYWHDGQKLTAKDISFTINLLGDAKYNPINPKEWSKQKIKVEVKDDYTILFKLSSPYAPFLNKLTFGILPKHLWKDVTPGQFTSIDLNLQPVGSGPFVFDSLKKDVNGNIIAYKLVANKKYYAHPPFLKELIFKLYPNQDAVINAYKQKEITSFGFTDYKKVDEFKNKKNTVIHVINTAQYFAVLLNKTKSIPLADKNVRQALQLAINRNEIITKALNKYAEPIYSPLIPPFILFDAGENRELVEYNPQRAKDILDKAGWKKEGNKQFREKDGQELKIKLVTTNIDDLTKTTEIIRNQWEKIGVNTEIVISEDKLNIRQKFLDPRDYESLLLGLEYSGNDPNLFFFWHSTGKKSPGLNFSMYDNEQVDKLLEESKKTKDRQYEIEKYKEISMRLLEDVPAIFLYSPQYLYITNKKIQGMDTKAITKYTNHLLGMNKWYTKTKRVRK